MTAGARIGVMGLSADPSGPPAERGDPVERLKKLDAQKKKLLEEL